MPVYVFDCSSIRVLENYYPETFPGFWAQMARIVGEGRWGSVREVGKELANQSISQHLEDWTSANAALFPGPTEEEMAIVAAIFAVPHFQQLIGQRQRLRGMPVADPFVVARGRSIDGVVVTEEAIRPNAAKIPNVCQHLGVRCVNVKTFLQEEGWVF